MYRTGRCSSLPPRRTALRAPEYGTYLRLSCCLSFLLLVSLAEILQPLNSPPIKRRLPGLAPRCRPSSPVRRVRLPALRAAATVEVGPVSTVRPIRPRLRPVAIRPHRIRVGLAASLAPAGVRGVPVGGSVDQHGDTRRRLLLRPVADDSGEVPHASAGHQATLGNSFHSRPSSNRPAFFLPMWTRPLSCSPHFMPRLASVRA